MREMVIEIETIVFNDYCHLQLVYLTADKIKDTSGRELWRDGGIKMYSYE